MFRKIFILLFVIILIALGVSIYHFKQDYDHRQFLKSIVTANQIDQGINQILARYNVKGASIAVIHDFELQWARGYGITNTQDPSPVTGQTLFDVASISKPVTAVATVTILNNQGISIDTPANDILRSWKVPLNQYTNAAEVTIRQLLSHKAGVNLDGYMGYSPGDTLPTLIQELNGTPPSRSPAIEVIKTPGSSYLYSGGGYYIIQQLVEDLTGTSFEDAVQRAVFEKLEMAHSTFLQDSLEHYYKSVASAHYQGTLIKVKRMRFGAVAAGGLKSTAEDLAKLLLEIQRSGANKKSVLVDQKTSEMLLYPESPGYGLGFMLKGEFFGHGGMNVGFISTMGAHRVKGYGIVVLTNSSRDDNLLWLVSDKSRREIIDLVTKVYNWEPIPGF